MKDRTGRTIPKRRIKVEKKLNHQDQKRWMRNGNVSNDQWTTRSGKPSLPVTRSRS